MTYRIAGVDEAGRGPLAGPVAAGAVILNPDDPISGLADSKVLSPSKREALEKEIKRRALAWHVGVASVGEIDRINILAATMLAMERAVAGLVPAPHEAWIDGNRAPSLRCTARAFVKGDALHPCISAASILAKVWRDREMISLHSRYPGYDFAKHKGYPTRAHLQALARYGPSPCHRLSFAPVRRALHGEA